MTLKMPLMVIPKVRRLIGRDNIETPIEFNRFSNLLIRAAPYKVPPADKKNSFSAEIPAGVSRIKVNYSD